MSLQIERQSNQRKRDRYIDELNYYSGQKQAIRENEVIREKLVNEQDMQNIESQIRKEIANEQAYRDRLELANRKMMKNAHNLVKSLEN